MELSVFYEHIEEAAKQSGRPVAEVLDIVSSAGIRLVEIDSLRLENEYDRIMPLLENSGINISCIYKTFDFVVTDDVAAEIRKAQQLADMAVECHSPRILIVPGFVTEGGTVDDKVYNKVSECVSRTAKYAKANGIQTVMEDFDNEYSPCRNIEGLLKISQSVPELGIAFDTGNFRYSCEDVLEAYDALKDRIVHVHLKDRMYRTDNKSDIDDTKYAGDIAVAMDGVQMYSCAVGDGHIPIAQVINKLKAKGYDGVYAIEHFGAHNQLQSILKSADYIRRIVND